MSTEVFSLTEHSINRAVEQHNVPLLEKETMFVMSNTACTFSEVYSNILYGVKPVKVRFNREPAFLFQETNISNLKRILALSQSLQHRAIEFSEAKIHFDTWFYQVTSDGILDTSYKLEYLVPITEAAEELNISRSMIYKYIDRGLETVGEKGSQKIPRSVLEAWKNPTYAFQMQWIHGIKKARTQTLDEKLEFINKQIFEFEREYQGTFHQLFGNVSNQEIDAMAEAVDIMDWKKLEERKRKLLKGV